jgi:Ni,Fe-hydrogenase maturation factor
MKVYVFGNEDLGGDMVAITIARKLDGVVEGVEFVFVKPNEDLPFVGEKEVVIMDAVEGVENIEMIEDNELDKINLTKSVSVHDFDLGFQLKYLKKLGKLGKVTIIGLPQEGSDDYLRIQSILRKLVEQEMQGS